MMEDQDLDVRVRLAQIYLLVIFTVSHGINTFIVDMKTISNPD